MCDDLSGSFYLCMGVPIRLYRIILTNMMDYESSMVKLVKHVSNKPFSLVFVVLLLIISILTPIITPDYLDQDPNQQGSITRATASRNFPSFDPRAFLSGSGKLHLIFQHEFLEYDAVSYHYYHTFELTNGSWATPTKVFTHQYTIFVIEPSETGFAIYYQKNGLSKKEYDEQTNTWLDPVLLFGSNQIHDYLGLQSEISWNVYSFFLFENGSFFVVWNFCFPDGSDASHEDEQSYIVSRIDPDGSIYSYPIAGLKQRCSIRDSLTFVEYNTSLFLYDQGYRHRTLLFPNGTWSKWQETPTSFDCRYEILATDRYILCYTQKNPSNYIWIMLDLASENLTVKELDISYSPNHSVYLYIDFKRNMSSPTSPLFVTALVRNGSVELWELNYLDNTWNQIASHNYEILYSSVYVGETTKFMLIQNGTVWRFFWDQRLEGVGPNEILTASYNTSSKEWSPIIQVTDTNTITDDYFEPVPSFLFYIVIIILCVLSKAKNRGKNER
ncbi:MAG: hypothetical protein ACFFC6_01225 [Promethearchaeota archaeon]